MLTGKKILAIVPARAGSKGLPHKNLRKICGSPLVSFPIRAAQNSDYVDHVFCSTESSTIALVANAAGADTSYKRPAFLAQDTTSSIDVLLDVIVHFESIQIFYDVIVMLEPTSPLTESKDVDDALEKFLQSESKFESLISICEATVNHPHFTFSLQDDGSVKPYLTDEWTFKRRQDLAPCYFQTGSLYVASVAALKTYRSFVSTKTLGYVVPKVKSFEIDDLIDLKIVEMLLGNLNVFQGQEMDGVQ